MPAWPNSFTNMQIKNKVTKFLRTEWKAKLTCLLLAIIVWVVADRLYVQNGKEEISDDDILMAMPD